MGLFTDINQVPCGSCQLRYNENPHVCDAAPDFCPCSRRDFHSNPRREHGQERKTHTMKIIQVELPEDVPNEKIEQLADTYRILADAAVPESTPIRVKMRFGKLNTSL